MNSPLAFLDELESDAQQAAIPSDQQITSIASLVQDYERLKKEIADLETQLKTKEEEFAVVEKKQLPEALDLAGTTEFKLTDGTLVKVESNFYASISEENAPVAFEWLRKNNHDGIIKTEVKVNYGKGDAAHADALKKLLEENKIPFAAKDAVHASTLKAFVKGQKETERVAREKGKPVAELPDKSFGVFEERVAKVTRAKK